MATIPRLIDLAQLEGGLALKQLVDQINASYPAAKVTTQIDDGSGNSTYYNVEDLLLVLKTIVDDQLGSGSGGSVDIRIQAAKDALQAEIDLINNKQVRDRVKVPGTMAADGTVVLNPDALATVTDLDKTLSYNLYYEDNTPVRDATGETVTYDFNTNTASSAPFQRTVTLVQRDVTAEAATVDADGVTFRLSNINLKEGSVVVKDAADQVIDPALYTVNYVSGKITFKAAHTEGIKVDYTYQTSELDYTAVTGTANVKVFPIGTFAFNALPADYQLDNTELNLVAYSEAIDQLALNISRDTDLINHIISVIGTEAIQAQLAQLNTSLQAEIDANKTAAEHANIDRENDIADVNNRIDNVLAVVDKHEEFNPADGQMEFVLATVPNSDIVFCHVNGLRYFENKHFTIDRAATTVHVITPAVLDTDGVTVITPAVTENVPAPKVTWTFTTAAGGFDMKATYVVEFDYENKEAVEPAVHQTY